MIQAQGTGLTFGEGLTFNTRLEYVSRSWLKPLGQLLNSFRNLYRTAFEKPSDALLGADYDAVDKR